MKYYDWVKKCGDWHYSKAGDSTKLCGKPMLGNNYAAHYTEMGIVRWTCEACQRIKEGRNDAEYLL